MFDVIHGKVTYIIKDDAFWVNVNWKNPENDFEYGDCERVRMIDFKNHILEFKLGKLLAGKEYLTNNLLGKKVSLDVYIRDNTDHLICEVQIIK